MKVQMEVTCLIEVEAETADEAFDKVHKLFEADHCKDWELSYLSCLTPEVPNAENSEFNE